MALTLSPEDIDAIIDGLFDKITEAQVAGLNYQTKIESPTTEAERQRYSVPVIKDAEDVAKRVASNVNLNDMANAWAADIIQLNSQAAEDLQTLGSLEDNVEALASQVSSDASEAAGSKEVAEAARDAALESEQNAEASKNAAASSATSAASSKSAADAAEDNVSTMKGQIETLVSQAESITQQKHILPVTLDSEIKGLSITRKASRVYISLNDIEVSES